MIESNGFKLLTPAPEELDITAGAFEIYIFALDMANKNI